MFFLNYIRLSVAYFKTHYYSSISIIYTTKNTKPLTTYSYLLLCNFFATCACTTHNH